jgi:MarR family transcriptional regulator, organic hydroperoxide resistance regulator
MCGAIVENATKSPYRVPATPEEARCGAGQGPSNVTQKQRLDLDNYLPYLVNRVGSRVVEIYTAETLARENLTIDMWRVMAALAHAGELRQVDLSTRTTIDPSTISRIVGRLVHLAFVTRRRSKTSSREVVVALSPKGSALVTRLIPVALDLEEEATEGLPAKDVQVLKRALRQVFENLAKGRAAAS